MTNKLPPHGLTNTNVTNVTISGIVKPLSGYALRTNIGADATGNDIWSGTAIIIPLPPDAGENMSVVSTSAQDGVGGTGALTIDVNYLDNNGIERVIPATMNGITNVPLSVNNIRFVQSIHVTSAGSNLLSVGTITIFKTGSPTTVYNQISPGTNMSLNTARMVPANKKLWITKFSASGGAAAGGKSADIRLRATVDPDDATLTPRLYHFLDDILVFNSADSRNIIPPIEIPAFAIVKCTSYASATQAGADVQATWRGILIDV